MPILIGIIIYVLVLLAATLWSARPRRTRRRIAKVWRDDFPHAL